MEKKLVCHLRKIAFDKNIKSIIEIERRTGLSRPTVIKMYENKNVHTIRMESFITVCDKLQLESLNQLIEYVKVEE